MDDQVSHEEAEFSAMIEAFNAKGAFLMEEWFRSFQDTSGLQSELIPLGETLAVALGEMQQDSARDRVLRFLEQVVRPPRDDHNRTAVCDWRREWFPALAVQLSAIRLRPRGGDTPSGRFEVLDDGELVLWGRERLEFNASQAVVIRELYARLMDDSVFVSKRRLQELAGSEADDFKLTHFFRDTNAYGPGRLISYDKQARRYRMNRPEA